MLGATDLNEPNVYWRLYGSTAGSYPDLDRFGRVVKSKWTKGNATPVNFYDVDLSYDRGSNITSTVDNIHKDAAGQRNFDVLYSMEDLSRLIRAREGTVASLTLTNPSRDEQWEDSANASKLDQAGNWLRHRLDLNGNGNFTDGKDEDQSSDTSYNAANETGSRTFTLGGTSTTYTYTFDANGNQTDDGQNYTYVWDAFNRLKQVKTRGGSPALVIEYRYNGLGFRTWKRYDTNKSGTVDSSDKGYWSCYDERWRIVATFRETDSDPKDVEYYHNAGVGGTGGVSYIDAVYRRDRDSNTAWTAASDGTLEDHKYLCANQHQDVGAVVTDTGKMVEWVKYSAYGVPYGLPAGDTDSDGDWDATDAGVINGWTTGYDVRADADLSGAVAAADATHANSITGGYQTLGRTVPTSTAVANRNTYASYEFELVLAGSKYHCDHRVYDAELGRWLRRDPAGYVDVPNFYFYVANNPMLFLDPAGLVACAAPGPCQCECSPVAKSDAAAPIAASTGTRPRPPHSTPLGPSPLDPHRGFGVCCNNSPWPIVIVPESGPPEVTIPPGTCAPCDGWVPPDGPNNPCGRCIFKVVNGCSAIIDWTPGSGYDIDTSCVNWISCAEQFRNGGYGCKWY